MVVWMGGRSVLQDSIDPFHQAPEPDDERPAGADVEALKSRIEDLEDRRAYETSWTSYPICSSGNSSNVSNHCSSDTDCSLNNRLTRTPANHQW